MLIYIPLSNILPRKITSQILTRDAKIADYIADEAKEYLLINDTLALSLLLHENLDRLEDAQYLFVQAPDGDITSHTFRDGFPQGLLALNTNVQFPYKIKEFSSDGRRVYDIAIPLLRGELGNLHLGVSLVSRKAEIADFTRINNYVATIIFIGLGAGILIFMFLGIFFSNRIIKLKDFATKIGNGDLDSRIDIKTDDEIGSLANSFNEMVRNLKEKIEKIKKLSYLEERSRIAIEFHDGLAQDLANIIKRLELCEKLFKIEPQRALEEMKVLRENIRDILNRTRQLMFDLKSPRDTDFNLSTNVTNYIKDYQKQNQANVRLNISGPVDNITPDRAQSIFYIIREALTNVKKHSLAKNVELSLEANNSRGLTINIKDDGKGFEIIDAQLSDPTALKLGLISMRQRTNSLGGVLAIDSKPSQGTRISVNIPLVAEDIKKL
jgi:signal transduction histidine kinase